MALLGRGRGTGPQWVTQELAKAAELAAGGQQERSRDRYARLARRLDSSSDDLRHYRGLALLGEAKAVLATGVFTDAMVRFREAGPLLADPGRQLPRWVVRQFAEERLRAADGGLEPLTDFLRAVADGAEPGDEETAVRVVAWLQQRCLTGWPAHREATARAALAALPGVDWPVLALTAVLRRDGRVAEAEALLASSVARGSGELWFRWGIQLSTLLRYDEAISAYDEAMRRGAGPGSPWSRGPWLRAESLLFRALAHQQLGRTRQADDDLRAASAVAPQDPRIHYSLGRLAVRLGADAEAWNHFTTALIVEAGFAPARLGLALVREQAGRPAEAIAHYQAALRHDPTSRAARIRLGATLLAAGRPDQAEGLLRPEMGQSYWDGMAAFHYGLARLRADDPARALETWERLGGSELREWTAAARDRLARNRLATDPAAARLQWQLALLDVPHVGERRKALREAAMREAAWLLLTGRDLPDLREKAAAALDLAESLPGPDRAEIRQHRLRALLDLAGGSTEGLAGLVDPADGLRDRCHLAVAALQNGRIEQAVALLAELPVDPDCDPAVARLRALVAERTEDWSAAVLWYQRFLTNDISAKPRDAEADTEADAEAAAATEPADDDAANHTLVLDIQAIAQARLRAPCTTAVDPMCTRIATDACAGCGREGCATHLYRPAGTRSFRCERCVAPALQAVLFAARRAGTPEEAERALASWAEAMDGHPLTRQLHRQLALLRAEAGDLDGALTRLPVGADTERVDLLIRRAGAAIGRGEPYAAIDDLGRVLGLQPGQPQALAAFDALAEHEACRHATAGRHEAAFDGYLALVRADPANPRLLHALGLSAYHLAKASGDPDHWHWTIGCLVSSLYSPGFWAEAGVATHVQIAEARRTMIDRLRMDLCEADAAVRRSGDEPDAWTVRLGVDVSACEILAVADTDTDTDGHAVISPTLAGMLGRQPEIPTSAAHWYGSLASHHYLYEDGRYAAAIRALDSVPEADRGAEWPPLLRQALTLRGMELHLDEQWPQALECIARAASLASDEEPDPVLAEVAAGAGLNAAHALFGEAEGDGVPRESWQGTIDLLEQAVTVAPDAADLRAELGTAHTRRAVELRNEVDDFVAVLAHVRRALDLLPADPEATELLTAVLADRAAALTRPGPDGDLLEAVQWWQELDDTAPDPAHRAGLARALSLLACSAALADHRALALDRMAWALQADPRWTGDARAEAPRTIAARLIADAVDDDAADDETRHTFHARAHRLRTALTYRDTPELRALMIALWKNEALFQYETRHYGQCAALLQEAIRLADEPEATVILRPEPGAGHRSDAGQAAHWRRYPQARTLIRSTVEHFTDEDALRELQARSYGSEDTASS